MCEPTIILATVAVVSTAVQVFTEVSAAKAQNRAIGEQLTQVLSEIDDVEASELDDRVRTARREQARIKVAAGESGLQLSGSINSLLGDAVMQQSLSNERIQLNAQNRRKAAVAEANSMYSRVQQPTILGAGLRMATAGVGGYYNGQSLSIARRNAARGPSGG